MYPKKQHKPNPQPKHKYDSVKELVLEKLTKEFSGNNSLNRTLIQCFVDDFFTRQDISEGALRALKQQIKVQVNSTQDNKVAMIRQLKSLTAQRLCNSQPTNVDSTLAIPSNTKDSVPNSRLVTIEKDQTPKQTTNQSDKDPIRRTSIYQLEGQDDEWAAIVNYDYAQYRKEQQEQKRLQQVNKQKIKEELDRQLLEKEMKKQRDKQAEIDYIQQSRQKMNEYDEFEEIKKEHQKQKLLQEKQMRDQQVNQEKLKRKEHLQQAKQMDVEQLQNIKEQMQQETMKYNQKRMEQKEKFQKIIKENEQLRHKALEELQLEKDYETKMQKLHIQQLEAEEIKREQIKKEREDRVKKLMSNYSESVLKGQHDQKKEEDQKLVDQMKQQENQDKEYAKFKKLKQHQKAEQIKKELQSQIVEKQNRISVEVSESNRLQKKWEQEALQSKQKEQEKQSQIKLSYMLHAEALKLQMNSNQRPANNRYNTTNKANNSMHEKMTNSELLQNKNILKKMANDSAIHLDLPIKKNEIELKQ